jgi:dUTPase
MVKTVMNPIDKMPKVRIDPEIHRFAYLRLYVDESTPEEFRNLYKEQVAAHNASLGLCWDSELCAPVLTGDFPNSGFDLLVPYETTVVGQTTSTMVKMKVKGEMYTINGSFADQYSAYYLMPRSSISKTSLIQSNHIGLIDMGYRGEIMAAVRNLDASAPYVIQEHSRLFQLCHPEALPIYVELVDRESDLSTTARGDGGFGSTGLRGVQTTPGQG